VDYLGDIGAPAALALWIASYGFGEETGWRGFAFHRMASGGWLWTVAIIGMPCGLWHLPYFFYKENFIAPGVLTLSVRVFLLAHEGKRTTQRPGC